MKKEKGTLNDKVGSLLKSKATWWFITLVLVAVVLLYAISRNMGIWFYAKEKGLQLTPLGSERIQQLEDTIERLKNENDELLKKHKDLETKYNLLLAKKRAQNTDIRYYCYVIQREIDNLAEGSALVLQVLDELFEKRGFSATPDTLENENLSSLQKGKDLGKVLGPGDSCI